MQLSGICNEERYARVLGVGCKNRILAERRAQVEPGVAGFTQPEEHTVRVLLARKQLRKSKLTGQASKRKKLHSAKGKSTRAKRPQYTVHSFNLEFPTADFYGFFFHAIPEEPGIVSVS